MPLKKKFALILILALVINFVAIVIYLWLFLARDIANNLRHFHEQFAVIVDELGPATTLGELGPIFKEKLQDRSVLNAIFLQAVYNTTKASLAFLPILLSVVLFYINKEVCKPLNKLNTAIDSFNHKNGYYATKHSRNEILKLSNNFFLMSEQIELSKRQKNEFISCISHDLKTPLTSILGYTQRLINPGISDEKKRLKYYQTILSKANTIQTMVEELNAYIMGEIQEVALQRVPIKKFLDEVIEEYQEELLTYSIHLTPHIDLDESLSTSLDINQIRRVFANIFSNAVIHGGKNMQITLTALNQDTNILIKIENNGLAPSNLDYDKVFDLMYQADTARTSQNHEGGGLGLAIVKQIIQKHDGSIKAYKPFGGGFGIELTLPL
ncbi:sensor histidine kinase [Cellulosilyticum sp. I15G10I2]|uniref:sensor histidine kinase n=1 Tax=Cellulosilyticum sp. I15G10I2 TaxID=1892843 RepID=UPI00085C5E3A|nr:HAMP domain-containing sensor histidine kinase [Cellulosilyticum sp. I15G10I2]